MRSRVAPGLLGVPEAILGGQRFNAWTPKSMISPGVLGGASVSWPAPRYFFLRAKVFREVILSPLVSCPSTPIYRCRRTTFSFGLNLRLSLKALSPCKDRMGRPKAIGAIWSHAA